MEILTATGAPETLPSNIAPLRICFLTTTYPDYQGSPRGPFIERLAQRLTQRGHEINVVTPQVFADSKPCEEWNGVTVHRFPYPSGGRKLVEHDRVPLKAMMFYLLRGTMWARRIAHEHACDVIHAHWVVPAGLMGAWAAKRTRKPLVVSAHGSDLLVWAKKRGIRSLARWTMRQARACSANSAEMADECRALGAADDRLLTIYETGVDATRFHPDVDGTAIRRQHQCNADEIVALFVGHLTRVKGVDVLLKAFARLSLPHLRLLIVGDGPEREPLETLATTLGVAERTTFAGAVSWQDMPPYFAASDFFVLPSRSEGMGIVLLEAMATGKPVIGSDVGGIPSLVTPNKNGWLVAPEDDEALAATLRLMTKDTAWRQRLGATALRMARTQFGEDKQVDRVEQLYAMAL
jgi:glycosyltransferase involved in cell wall biosynthesis